MLSRVRLFATPMACSLSGFSVHGIFQQEYWSGLPFPALGDLLDPGIEPTSPALGGQFFTTAPPGKYNEGYFFTNADVVAAVGKEERSHGSL